MATATATPNTTLALDVYADTESLLRLYTNDAGFRQRFNYLVDKDQGQASFRERPLKFYISVLAKIDPHYRNDVSNKIDSEKVKKIFDQFIHEGLDRYELERRVRQNDPEFATEVLEADEKTAEPEQKEHRFAVFAELTEKNHPELSLLSEESQRRIEEAATTQDAAQEFMNATRQTPPPVVLPARGFSLRSLSMPGFAKDAFSSLQRFIANLLSRPQVVGGGIGALGGYAFGGPLGGVVGGVLGAGLGAAVTSGGTSNDNSQNNQQSSSSSMFNAFNNMRNNPASRVGKRLGGDAAKDMGKQLAKKAAKELAKKGVIALFSTPVGWVILGFLALLVIIPLIVYLLNSSSLFPPFAQPTQNVTTTTTQTQVSLIKSGPSSVNNGQSISYTFSLTYTGAGTANIEVDDPLPAQTTLGVASDGGTNQSGIVQWTFNNVPANQAKSFSLTLNPSASDIWVVNTASANILSTTGTTTGQQPNNNNCGGKYSLSDPLGNFGDPSCNFTKTPDLYTALQQADPANADYWFSVVIPCESSYNPNSYNSAAVDSAGAWGLFQMGRGKNGQFDHGDVSWQQQVTNATTYEKQGGWSYWACARGQ